MVEIQKIEAGIARYLDAELIPKLPENSWKQFGVGLVSALVAKRGGAVLKAFGVVDEAGCWDVDVLREIAKERIPETGLPADVPFIGKLTIYRADVDKLHEHILR